MILEEFHKELSNSNTRYFIIVSGDHLHDKDFVQYSWKRSRYNLVRPGDLFLYRKKDKNDIIREFFFYGVGRFKSIEGEDAIIAELDKVHRFNDYVTKTDLTNYEWKWKDRGSNWAHFFNQYGMDKIPKEDFVKILKKGFETSDIVEEYSETTEFLSQISQKDYFVEDNIGKSKIRRGQQDFSNTVKSIYKNKCCVCGLSTKSFLIGSHIIPWAKRKDTRLNPSNGLSLCAMHDKAFDKGYFTIGNKFEVIVSRNIRDSVLSDELMKYDGNVISLPTLHLPNQEFLEYHRSNIYELTLI